MCYYSLPLEHEVRQNLRQLKVKLLGSTRETYLEMSGMYPCSRHLKKLGAY